MKALKIIMTIVLISSLFVFGAYRYRQELEPLTGTVSTNEVRVVFPFEAVAFTIGPDPEYSSDIIYVRFHTNTSNLATIKTSLNVSANGNDTYREVWITGNGTNTHYQVVIQRGEE